MKKIILTDDEKALILSSLHKSDEAISKETGRTINFIRTFRKQYGFERDANNKIKVPKVPSQSFTEDERQTFFKAQLVNSLFYTTLKEQFTDDEIKYYLEEWGVLCVQFEDIVATEKRQIDELIKAEIMGNRVLRNIRITEDELKKIIKEIEDFRKDNPTLETDEKLQERDQLLMLLARTLSAQSEAMTQNYQKNVDTKNKLLEQLNSRRVDRLDQIKRSGTTFIGLVEKFQNRELREREGRHIELIKLAKEQKLTEWRKVIQFPNGQKDSVLLDDASEEPEENVVYTKGSKYFNQYSTTNDKSVLIIEPDQKKKIFLAKKLKNNKIAVASSSEEAISKIKEDEYHFILLGNDALDFIEHVSKKDLCKISDFVVHADNKDTSEKIYKILKSSRNVEQYPFEDLVRESNE